MKMKLFIPICKVDEAKRMVYGRATQELPDKVGEIFDYESSVPYFKKWSESVFKDSDGKSMGNVRSMHSKVAAGKLVNIDYKDDEKAIDVAAKIVDNNEWEKVLEGVHTGFSIGGDYIRKWADTEKPEFTRFTADPSELSIVDRPCLGAAKFFEICKADGTSEQKEFKKYEGEEIMDAFQAMQALQVVFNLMIGERQEADQPGSNEPADQVPALEQAVASLKAFIASEIEEDNSKDNSFAMAEQIKGLAKMALRAQENKMATPLAKAGKKFSDETLADLNAKHQECVKCNADLGKALTDLKNTWEAREEEQPDPDAPEHGPENGPAGQGDDVPEKCEKPDDNMQPEKSDQPTMSKSLDLEKALLEKDEQISKLEKRIAELEAEPAPVKGVKTIVVEKVQETALNNTGSTQQEEELNKIEAMPEGPAKSQALIKYQFKYTGGSFKK